MAKIAPDKCPKCGHDTVSLHVVAVGLFKSGVFQTFDPMEQVASLEEDVEAMCDNDECGHEWTWEHIP